MEFSRHMTDAEALMWNIEADPWLAPSGGSITLFDGPVDIGRFRRAIEAAVASTPRLRQHIQPAHTRLSTPQWVADPAFAIDEHVRHIAAPGDGSTRALLDWLAGWLAEGFDRQRPLWQYVVIDGLARPDGASGGPCSAVATKLHHVVTDGLGAFRLAESYMTPERDAPDPPPVDLAAIVAEAAANDRPDTVVDEALEVAFRPLELTRRLFALATHPDQARTVGSEAADVVRTAANQSHPAGSEAWAARSGRRHLEIVSVPFDAARRAAKALGGTLNDLFLTGAVEAAHRYHVAVGAPVERLHITFVVSTKADPESSENAFTPVPIDVPAGPMPLRDRFTGIHDLVAARRAEVHGSGAMSLVAPLANLLPTGLVTGVVRDQARHIDFATSNLPGFRHDTYVGGARTEHLYAFGPVAGTAFNITQISVPGTLDIGVNIDPAAVTDPGRLRACLDAAYQDLLTLAG